jgi:hypothetical protein
MNNKILSALNLSYLSLIVFLPIFVSIDMDYIVSLDRSVWNFGEFHNDSLEKNPKPYLITFPISLILIILFGIKNFSNILNNRAFQYAIVWFLFVLIVNFMFGDIKAWFFKIIFGMIIFSSSILVFDEFFSNNRLKLASLKEKLSVEDFYILKPFFVVASILFISHVYYADDTFIFSWLKIYNFDQYLTYALFLFIGACFRGKWQFIFSFLVVLFFAYATRSDGIKIMLFLLFLAYLLYTVKTTWLIKYSSLFMKLAIFCVITFQLLSYFFPDFANITPFTLSARMEKVYFYYSSIDIVDFIIPLHDDASVIEYLHNEILQIFSVVGLLGGFFHYSVIYSRIKIILMSNTGMGVSLAMVVIIGGVLVFPTIHPYTAIIIAYLISFYSSAGLPSKVDKIS